MRTSRPHTVIKGIECLPDSIIFATKTSTRGHRDEVGLCASKLNAKPIVVTCLMDVQLDSNRIGPNIIGISPSSRDRFIISLLRHHNPKIERFGVIKHPEL